MFPQSATVGLRIALSNVVAVPHILYFLIKAANINSPAVSNHGREAFRIRMLFSSQEFCTNY